MFISGCIPLTLLLPAIYSCNKTNQSKKLILKKKIQQSKQWCSGWSWLFSCGLACVVSSLPHCSTWPQSQLFAQTDSCLRCNFFFCFLSYFILFPWDAAGGWAVQGAEFSHCGGLVPFGRSALGVTGGKRWDRTAP